MILVLGLIIAFALILIFANHRMRSCRWRAGKSGDAEGKNLYRCVACGAETFTSDGKPPSDCFAGSRS